MRPSDQIAGRATTQRRTRTILVVACMAQLGCGVGVYSDHVLTAREQFVANGWPALTQCLGCHGSQPSIDFLAPGTADAAYDTVFSFQPPVVDLGAPSASLLVTMGKHTGPALTPQSAEALLAWLDAEHTERVAAPGDPVVIGPIALQMGVAVTVDLGPPGATLHFVPSQLDAGLYLDELDIQAGARPLHVKHPLFVSRPPKGAAPVPDDVDRYGDLDVTIDPNEHAAVAGGGFLNFAPTDPIAIHFKTLEAP